MQSAKPGLMNDLSLGAFRAFFEMFLVIEHGPRSYRTQMTAYDLVEPSRG